MSQAPQRYLDDFHLGEQFTAPPVTLRAEHFKMFSEITGDDHPIHDDADYAAAHGFEGPVAHGLLLLATTAFGACPASSQVHASMIAMLGTKAKFRKPAFVGTTLIRRFEVCAIEPKGAERGILKLALVLRNPDGEVVLDGEHVIMLRRRRDG